MTANYLWQLGGRQSWSSCSRDEDKASLAAVSTRSTWLMTARLIDYFQEDSACRPWQASSIPYWISIVLSIFKVFWNTSKCYLKNFWKQIWTLSQGLSKLCPKWGNLSEVSSSFRKSSDVIIEINRGKWMRRYFETVLYILKEFGAVSVLKTWNVFLSHLIWRLLGKWFMMTISLTCVSKGHTPSLTQNVRTQNA